MDAVLRDGQVAQARQHAHSIGKIALQLVVIKIKVRQRVKLEYLDWQLCQPVVRKF